MKAGLSRPSDGQFEADVSEVESKGPTEAGPRCASWTNEKHMMYLSSLEESFVNQLSSSSQFHLHVRNLLGRSRTNQRQSDSSITTEGPSDTSQFKVLQQGRRKDMIFGKSKSGIRKENTSFSLSESQWIRRLAENSGGKGINVRTNCQVVVDHQSSYTGKSVKRERHCYSKKSTSQAEPSSSSRDSTGYGEVSDQNFINEEIIGEESSQTYKKKNLSSPVTSIDQVVPPGKSRRDSIKERG